MAPGFALDVEHVIGLIQARLPSPDHSFGLRTGLRAYFWIFFLRDAVTLFKKHEWGSNPERFQGRQNGETV